MNISDISECVHKSIQEINTAKYTTLTLSTPHIYTLFLQCQFRYKNRKWGSFQRVQAGRSAPVSNPTQLLHECETPGISIVKMYKDVWCTKMYRVVRSNIGIAGNCVGSGPALNDNSGHNVTPDDTNVVFDLRHYSLKIYTQGIRCLNKHDYS